MPLHCPLSTEPRACPPSDCFLSPRPGRRSTGCHSRQRTAKEGPPQHREQIGIPRLATTKPPPDIRPNATTRPAAEARQVRRQQSECFRLSRANSRPQLFSGFSAGPVWLCFRAPEENTSDTYEMPARAFWHNHFFHGSWTTRARCGEPSNARFQRIPLLFPGKVRNRGPTNTSAARQSRGPES